MKKNSKKRKFTKILIIFALVQLLIVGFLSMEIFQHQQANENNIKTITVTIEQIKKSQTFFSRVDDVVMICSDSVWYQFLPVSTISNDEYGINELYEALSVGDELTIQYHELTRLFERMNYIADARSENTVYRSIDEYNIRTRDGFKEDIIAISILEGLFLLFLGIYLYVLMKEYFELRYKKKLKNEKEKRQWQNR